MNSTTIFAEPPLMPTFVIGEDGEKKNAPEFEALEASQAAFAAVQLQPEYSTEQEACQIAVYPTLDDIACEIAVVARERIEESFRELSVTRARIELGRSSRAATLKTSDDRVSSLQSQLNVLEGERTAMELRAKTFLAGGALKTTMDNIHLAINVRQLELEDALATAQADTQEIQTEIEATAVTDALELQFAEQYLEELETAAPEIAEQVRLAASANENIAAAHQAGKDGLIDDARTLLGKAKQGNADPQKIAEVEQVLIEAEHARLATTLISRMNAVVDQSGGVNRIRKLMEEAASLGVANQVEHHAQRALRAARTAGNVRFALARPVAEHLADEGLTPVVGDGRIEVWKEIAKNGHAASWTLDRVMVLYEGVWNTKKPRVPITSQDVPTRVRHSRWFNRRGASTVADPTIA